MTSPKEQYAALLSLTKHYLLQEYQPKDNIFSDQETYTYFRNQVSHRNEAPTAPIAQKQTTPPAPPMPKSLPPIPPPAQSLPKIIEVQPPGTDKPRITESPKVVPPKTSAPVPSSPSASKESGSTAESRFKLELPPPPSPADFSELRRIIQEKHPRLSLIDSIPDDAAAKTQAALWKHPQKIPQILIFGVNEQPKQIAFLENLAKALTLHGFQTQVVNALKIERDQQWQTFLNAQELKLFIGSDVGFNRLPALQKVYKHDSKKGFHYLGNRPLFLLSDISFYLKEPALKLSLWNALKQLLAFVPADS